MVMQFNLFYPRWCSIGILDSLDVFYLKSSLFNQRLLISRGSGMELCEEYKTENDTISGGPGRKDEEVCPRSRIKYNLPFVFIKTKTKPKTILPHRLLQTQPGESRAGGRRQVADGLRSVPLLTVAAPDLPGPCIGVPALGDRDLEARGRKGTREPHWGSRPAGEARWTGSGPSRQGRGRWAGRVANALRPHLGHHFLELALRHRHGGHLAASVPAGRGSAAPGLPQAALHTTAPSRQPPTPPPLATGSRPPRQTFRFLYVTSEVIPEVGLVPTHPVLCGGRVPELRAACSDGGNSGLGQDRQVFTVAL